MRNDYKAPWGWKLILITGILLVILGAVLFAEPNPVVSFIIWITILGCAAFGIYGYHIGHKHLKIKRLGWTKKVSFSEISSAEVKPNAMKGSIRSFGNGGLFGYVGSFRNSILGSYKAYVTKKENTVLIETTDEKRILVSPDKPDEFVEVLNRKINHTI